MRQSVSLGYPLRKGVAVNSVKYMKSCIPSHRPPPTLARSLAHNNLRAVEVRSARSLVHNNLVRWKSEVPRSLVNNNLRAVEVSRCQELGE